MSLSFSQTTLLNYGIFATNLLGCTSKKIYHGVPAIVYISPTETNLNLLVEELNWPGYSNYNICRVGNSFPFQFVDFCGEFQEKWINYIAEHDPHGLVSVVKVASTESSNLIT